MRRLGAAAVLLLLASPPPALAQTDGRALFARIAAELADYESTHDVASLMKTIRQTHPEAELRSIAHHEWTITTHPGLFYDVTGLEIAGPLMYFNEAEYYINLTDLDEDDHGHMHFRAFATQLDGMRFLNLQMFDHALSSAYTIMAYDFDTPTSLRLRFVSLASEETKPKTQAALVAFVRRRQAEGSLYDDEVFVCSRRAAKKP